jgi:hypothetical protein
MLVRIWTSENFHSLFVGMQNGLVILGDSSAIPYKSQHNLTIGTSSGTPRYLPNWSENLCSSKTMHMNIYSNFIHDFQTVEATKTFFNMLLY